jgi:hypothetical protein
MRTCRDLVQRPRQTHYLNIGGAKQAEHEVIVYCEANPDKLIIQAIAAVFKEMRARLGIMLKPSD